MAYPDILDADSVAAWILERHPERLILHPRAARALNKHDYGDARRAYRALDLLAVEYRNMRMRDVGDSAARDGFQERLEREGLELSEAITDTGFGQFSELYTVDYGGERRRIDLHLKSKTKGFDPTRTLRAYFFWDDDKNVVVLCHLPSHLDNTRT